MKKAFWSFLSFTAIIFVLQCCKNNSTKIGDSDNKFVVQSLFAKHYPFFDPQVLKSIVSQRVINDSLLQPLYAGKEYNLLWINDTLNTEHLNGFINILTKSREHGLPANLFNSLSIASLVDSINSGLLSDSSILYNRLAYLEHTSARIITSYVNGMTYGFVKPEKLYKEDFAIKLNTADSAFYSNLYNDILSDPVAAMQKSEPSDSIYLAVMKEYKALLDHEGWAFDKIKEIEGANYRLGAKNKNIAAIARRLTITGEYTLPIINDTLAIDSINNDVIGIHELTPELMAAINTFRRKNSLPVDEKEVGNATIKALNRPLDYYKTKLCANLERYRWRRTKQPADKHIEVNVAAFLLFATQKDSIPMAIKVCVGKPSSKTPMLESNMKYINLNPKWNVPVSIAKNEISVLQKNDPTYLKRHNMKLYKGGKEVDYKTIDWSKVNPVRLGYTIVQESGGGNALGRLKFMFNNDFSVYLHDTPVKSAFGKINRAVSHGCIRVQQPLDLAYFLTDANNLYKDRIRYSIGYEPATKEGKEALKADKLKKLSDIISMNKDKPVTIFIDYFTVYHHPVDNSLYYADDIYEYDDAIVKELEMVPV